jgi:hypothetical protein
LYDSLLAYNKLLYTKYLYFYYQAKVACYSNINPDMAIGTLQEMLGSNEIAQNPFYLILAHSNLAFLYFEKGDYHACIRTLNKVYINDFYSKVDVSLKVKLTIRELMARYELEDMDVMEYRLEQVRKETEQDWKGYRGRELLLADLIRKMVADRDYVKDKAFRESVDEFLAQRSLNDTELTDYDQWIKKKAKIL